MLLQNERRGTQRQHRCRELEVGNARGRRQSGGGAVDSDQGRAHASAKAVISEATGIREKEAAVFAAEKAELTANINALAGAMATFEKGMGGGFLQT